MTKIIKPVILFVITIAFFNSSRAQKIEYNFGKKSDVIDSVLYILNWYKQTRNELDIKKLNLFIGIDNCDGNINLYISQYTSSNKEMIRLVKKTNRYISINKAVSIPVLFATDILAKEMADKISYINMNGYHILIRKNEKNIWKVIKTQVTF